MEYLDLMPKVNEYIQLLISFGKKVWVHLIIGVMKITLVIAEFVHSIGLSVT